MASGHRSAAQIFDLVVGPVLILVGALGFIAASAFDVDQGSDFIIFEVNGWHNIVHIASGLLLLFAAGTWLRARTLTMAFGATYVMVGIIGAIDGHDFAGWFPVDGADDVLHIVLGLAALLFGAAPMPAGTGYHALRDSGGGLPGSAGATP
jgi:hypothetical protein